MKRLKIGVIGCGAIAQVQHMPNLANLPDLFEVTMVCDLSLKAAEYVASKFKVPSFTTNYFELLESDVDAQRKRADAGLPRGHRRATERRRPWP